jgi:glycerophosphoryl diester phosphodiesterase
MRFAFTALDRSIRNEPLKIAHRGASAYAPENSLLAFEKAAELGSDMVEVDLRVTADGHPVIAHDESLKRLYSVDATIDSLTLSELTTITSQHGEAIPTFEQVTAVCARHKLGLYLDIKQMNPSAMAQVYAHLVRYGLLPVTIAGSFRPDYVAEIKAHWPDFNTSILFGSTHIDAGDSSSGKLCSSLLGKRHVAAAHTPDSRLADSRPNCRTGCDLLA